MVEKKYIYNVTQIKCDFEPKNINVKKPEKDIKGNLVYPRDIKIRYNCKIDGKNEVLTDIYLKSLDIGVFKTIETRTEIFDEMFVITVKSPYIDCMLRREGTKEKWEMICD